MAKIKVILEKGESILDANNDLRKALEFQEKGEAHKETFEDPAIKDLYERLSKAHVEIYNKILEEVAKILEGSL